MLGATMDMLVAKYVQDAKSIAARMFEKRQLQRPKQSTNDNHQYLIQLKNALSELETLLVQVWNLDRVISKRKDATSLVSFDTLVNNQQQLATSMFFIPMLWSKITTQFVDEFHASLKRIYGYLYIEIDAFNRSFLCESNIY